MDALGLSAFLSSFQASQWMLEDFNQKLFSYRHIMTCRWHKSSMLSPKTFHVNIITLYRSMETNYVKDKPHKHEAWHGDKVCWFHDDARCCSVRRKSKNISRFQKIFPKKTRNSSLGMAERKTFSTPFGLSVSGWDKLILFSLIQPFRASVKWSRAPTHSSCLSWSLSKISCSLMASD